MHHYTTKRTLFTSVSYCTIQYTVVQNNMLLYGNIMFYSICPSHPVIASTVSWVQFIPVYQLKKVRTVTPPPPSPHMVQLLLSCTWGYEGLCTAGSRNSEKYFHVIQGIQEKCLLPDPLKRECHEIFQLLINFYIWDILYRVYTYKSKILAL